MSISQYVVKKLMDKSLPKLKEMFELDDDDLEVEEEGYERDGTYWVKFVCGIGITDRDEDEYQWFYQEQWESPIYECMTLVDVKLCMEAHGKATERVLDGHVWNGKGTIPYCHSLYVAHSQYK